MQQKSGRYSEGSDIAPFVGDPKTLIHSVYHGLNLDIRETAQRIGASHDTIVVYLWKMMLRDMFEAGAQRYDVIDAVRMISAEHQGRM